MDKWESRRKRSEKDWELYRDIFYEPPYSVREAAVGLIVIAIGPTALPVALGGIAPRRRPVMERRTNSGDLQP
jgi:hypothetical protein